MGVGLKTDAVAEHQMRAAIRELVSSVDPGGRLDKEAEDVCSISPTLGDPLVKSVDQNSMDVGSIGSRV